MLKPIISPSILSANFGNLAQSLKTIEDSGSDWVHIDVMDGHFVPNLSFGPPVISALRPLTNLKFDVHLMIANPQERAPDYINAGADNIIFHVEAIVHAHRLVQYIREEGCSPGLSLVPSTSISQCSELLSFVDQVLVMTVNPGYGGQSLIPEVVNKIAALSELREKRGYAFYISVDGGVNEKTAPQLIKAGADVLVTGSSFFSSNNAAQYVQQLRKKSDNVMEGYST